MEVTSTEGEGEEPLSREDTPSHRSVTLPPNRWGWSTASHNRTSVSPTASSGGRFKNKSLNVFSSPKEPLTPFSRTGAMTGNTVTLPRHHEKSLRVDQCNLPLEHIAKIKKIFEAYDFVKSGLSAKMDVEVRRQLLTEDPPCIKRDLLHRRRRGSRVSVAVVEKSDSDEDGKEASEESEKITTSFSAVDNRGPFILPEPPVRDEAYIMKRRRLLLFGMIKTQPGIDSEHREDGEEECLLPVTRESDSESEDEAMDSSQLVPGGLRASQRWYQKAHNIAMDHIQKNQAIVEEEIQRLERWKIHQKMLRAEAKANLEINALANIVGQATPLPITMVPSSAGIPFTFFAQQIVARYFSSFFPMSSGTKTFEPRRKQHILAVKEIFRLMDTNADGLVSWDEFSAHVLQAGQRYILKAELRRTAEKAMVAPSTASMRSTAPHSSATGEKEERDGTDHKSASKDEGSGGEAGKARRASSVDNEKENQQTGESAVPEFGVEFKLGFTPEPTNCSTWQSTYPLVHHLYHQHSFSKMVISYRSRRYITAGTDGLVKLWKPDPRLLDAHRRMTIVHERNLLCTRCAITDLSLSPPSMGNAEVVAVAAMDGTVTLLRSATGEVVRTLLGFRSKASNTSSVAVLNDLVSRGADREKKEFEANDLMSLRNRQPMVSGSVIRMPYTIPAYHDDMMEIFFGKTNRYFQGLDVVAPTYTHLKRPVVSSSDILYEFGAEKLLKKLHSQRRIAEGTTTFCWYATALAISRCMPLGASNCVLKDGGYLVLGFEAGVAQVYALNMNWFSVNQLSATRVEPPSGSQPVTSFLLHNGPVSQILISDTSDLMISTGSDSIVQVRIFSRLTSPHIVLGEVNPKTSFFLSAPKIPQTGGRKGKSSPLLLRKSEEKKTKGKRQNTLSILPANDGDRTNGPPPLRGECEEFLAFSRTSQDDPKTPVTATDSFTSVPSSLVTEEKNSDLRSRVSEKEEREISLVKGEGSEVGHTKRITCICYHESQHLIVSGAMDHCVIFWTSRSNRFLRRLDLRNLQYFTSSPSIGVSDDGVASEFGACGYPIDVSFMERHKDPLRLVVVDNRRVIRLLNAANGNLLEVMMDNSPSSLALGDLLVARYEKNDDRLLLGGRCLRVWDIPRDEEYAQDYVGHKKPVIFTGMDHALRIFVTADEENIIMWNFTILPHELALQRREDRRLRREQERMQAHQNAEKRKALRMARKARAEFLAAEAAERKKREKARVSATVKRRSVLYGESPSRSRRSSRASSNTSSIAYSESDSDAEEEEEYRGNGGFPFRSENTTRSPTEVETEGGGDRGRGKHRHRPSVADGSETENSEVDEINAIDARAYEDEIPVVEYVDANQYNLTYWRTNSRIVRSWKVPQGVRSVALETSTRAGGIYVALLRERSIVQYNSFNGAPLRKFLFPETANDVYRICAGETILTQEDARGVTPLVCAAYEEDSSGGIASIYHLNDPNDDPDSAVKKELQERAELLARGVKLPKETRETGAIRSHRQLLLKGEPCTCVAILPSLGVLLMGGRHRLHYSPIMESTSYPLPCITLQDTPSREQERLRRKSLRAFNEKMAALAASEHRSQSNSGGKNVGQTLPFSSSVAWSSSTTTIPGIQRTSTEEKPSLHLLALFPGRLVEDPVAVGRGLTRLPIHTAKSPSRRTLPPPFFPHLRGASSTVSSPLTLSPTVSTGEVNFDTAAPALLPGKGRDATLSPTSRSSPGRGSQKCGKAGGGEEHTRKSELEEINRGRGSSRWSVSSRTTAYSVGNESEQDAIPTMDPFIRASRSVSALHAADLEAVGPLPVPVDAAEGTTTAAGDERNASTPDFYMDAQEAALGFIGHIVPVRDLGYVFTGRNDGMLQLWNIRSSSEVMRCRVTLQTETITALSISCFGSCRTEDRTGGHPSTSSPLVGGKPTKGRIGAALAANASPSLSPLSSTTQSLDPFPQSPHISHGAGDGPVGKAVGGSPHGDGVGSEAGGMGGGHHRRQNVLRDSYFVAVGDQSGYVVLLDFNALPWEEDAPLDVLYGLDRRVVVLDRWRAHRQDVRGICFVGNPDVRGGDVVGMEYMNGSKQVFLNEQTETATPGVPHAAPWLPATPTHTAENPSGGQEEDGKENGGYHHLIAGGGMGGGSPCKDGQSGAPEWQRIGMPYRTVVGSASSPSSTVRVPITLVTAGEDTYTYVWVWEAGTVNCLGCFGGGVGNPVVPPLIQLPRRSMDVFEMARRLYVLHRLVRGFHFFQSHRFAEEVEKAVKQMEKEATKLLEDDSVWQLAYGGSLAFLSPAQFPCYKQTFWSTPLLHKNTSLMSATNEKKTDARTEFASSLSNVFHSSALGGDDDGFLKDDDVEEREVFSAVFDQAGLKGMRDRLYQCPSTEKHPISFSSSGASGGIAGATTTTSITANSSISLSHSTSASWRREGERNTDGVGKKWHDNAAEGIHAGFLSRAMTPPLRDAASDVFAPYVFAFMRGTYEEESVTECLFRVVTALRPEIKKFFKEQKRTKRKPSASGGVGGAGVLVGGATAGISTWQPQSESVLSPSGEMKGTSGSAVVGFIEEPNEGGESRSGEMSSSRLGSHRGATESQSSILRLSVPMQRPTTGVQPFSSTLGSSHTSLHLDEALPPSVAREAFCSSLLQKESLQRPASAVGSSSELVEEAPSLRSLRSPLGNSVASTSARHSPFSSTLHSSHGSPHLPPLSPRQRKRRATKKVLDALGGGPGEEGVARSLVASQDTDTNHQEWDGEASAVALEPSGSFGSFISSPSGSPLSMPRRLSMTRKDSTTLAATVPLEASTKMRSDHRFAKGIERVALSPEEDGGEKGGGGALLLSSSSSSFRHTTEKKDDTKEEEFSAGSDSGKKFSWTVSEDGKDSILLRGTRGVPMYKVVYTQPALARKIFLHVAMGNEAKSAEEMHDGSGGGYIETAMARQMAKLPTILTEEFRRLALQGISVKALSDRRLSSRDGYVRRGKDTMSRPGGSGADGGEGGMGGEDKGSGGVGKGVENLEEAALLGVSSATIVERAYISRRRKQALEQILNAPLSPSASPVEEKEKKAQEMQLAIDAGLIVIDSYSDFSTTKTTNVLFDKEKVVLKPTKVSFTKVPEVYIQHAIPESFHIQQMGEGGRDLSSSSSSGENSSVKQADATARTTRTASSTSSAPARSHDGRHDSIQEGEVSEVGVGAGGSTTEDDPSVSKDGQEPTAIAPSTEENGKAGAKGAARKGSRRASKKTHNGGDWYVEREKMKLRRKFQNSLWSPARIVHTLMAWKSPIPLHLRAPSAIPEDEAGEGVMGNGRMSTTSLPAVPGPTERRRSSSSIPPTPPPQSSLVAASHRPSDAVSVDSSRWRAGSRTPIFFLPLEDSNAGKGGGSRPEAIPSSPVTVANGKREEDGGPILPPLSRFTCFPPPPPTRLVLPHFLPEFLEPCGTKKVEEAPLEEDLAPFVSSTRGVATPSVRPCRSTSSSSGHPPMSAVGGLSTGVASVGSTSRSESGETGGVGVSRLGASGVERGRASLVATPFNTDASPIVPSPPPGSVRAGQTAEGSVAGTRHPSLLPFPTPKGRRTFSSSRAVWDTALDYNEGKTNLNALVASEVLFLKRIAKRSIEDRERFFHRVTVRPSDGGPESGSGDRNSGVWEETGKEGEEDGEDGKGRLNAKDSITSLPSVDKTVVSMASSTENQFSSPVKKLREYRFCRPVRERAKEK